MQIAKYLNFGRSAKPAIITTSPTMAATTHAPSNTLQAFFATGAKPSTQAGLSAMLDEIRSLVLLAQSPGASIISGATGETIVARAGFLKPAPAAPQARPAAPAAVRPAPQASASTPRPRAQAPAPAPEPVRTETPTLDKFNSLKGGMATLFYNQNAKQITAEQNVRNSETKAAERDKAAEVSHSARDKRNTSKYSPPNQELE